MCSTTAPIPGTWEYARAAVHVVTDHEYAWSTDDLTAIRHDRYGVTIQFGSEYSAEFAAVALNVTGIPVQLTPAPGYDGYSHKGTVDGIKVEIVSCYTVPDDAPVGEIPPVCRTCSGSMRVPSSTRAGVTTACPACAGYGFLAVAS